MINDVVAFEPASPVATKLFTLPAVYVAESRVTRTENAPLELAFALPIESSTVAPGTVNDTASPDLNPAPTMSTGVPAAA